MREMFAQQLQTIFETREWCVPPHNISITLQYIYIFICIKKNSPRPTVFYGWLPPPPPLVLRPKWSGLIGCFRKAYTHHWRLLVGHLDQLSWINVIVAVRRIKLLHPPSVLTLFVPTHYYASLLSHTIHFPLKFAAEINLTLQRIIACMKIIFIIK